jgi:hypothetical protein
MERSESLNELAAALNAAQAEIEDAAKAKANPAFRSKYGLSVAQFCEPSPEGTLMLTTMLLHKSGQFLAGTAMLPLAKADPQGYGSALTYARRYGLAAMVGVCPEDDDGNAASGRSNGSAPRENAPSAPRSAPQAAPERWDAPTAPKQGSLLDGGKTPACETCGTVLAPAVVTFCANKGWAPLCREHQPKSGNAMRSGL